MSQYLIDAHPPSKINLWKGEKFVHVRDIDPSWSDSQIWNYAKKNELTIVTKDADFSNRIITTDPPPKVIHFKVGNMKLAALRSFVESHWEKIEALSQNYKLINVHPDRIIAID